MWSIYYYTGIKNKALQLPEHLVELMNKISNLTEHAIDTGAAHRIKQRPLWTPLAFQGEEEKEIQAMSEAGIIQPSTSPWASPVCLVKKMGLPDFALTTEKWMIAL